MPKPDHRPKSDRVSMAWAGVKSENLATVWLLYHLTDMLNMSEFRQVVQLLGLARKESEAYEDYVKRIRDKHGVVVNNEAIMEAAFEEAKKEIKSDMIFSGHEDALENLSRLHFKIDINHLNLKEKNAFHIYRLGFIRLRSLNFEMKRRFTRIQELLEQYPDNKNPDLKEALFDSLENFYISLNSNTDPRLIYTESRNQVNLSEMQPVTPEGILSRFGHITHEDIWIDGLIPSEVIDLLQSHLIQNFRRLLTLRHYDMEVLSKIRDFRILINLFYSIYLSKKMGISTELDPVLSFPLGPNSISIMEAALAYQTIMTGHVYPVTDMMVTGMVPIITRILDRDGETIWEYTPKPKQILKRSISVQISEILRLVMEKGTGKKARDAVKLSLDIEGEKFDISIPSFGKTGTANRFTNSSFVGFIPGPKEDSGQLDIQQGYVVASYVGYDDNRPMKGKHISIYGSSGALPLWVDTTNTIVNSHDYRNKLEPADLAFDAQSLLMPENKELIPIPLSPITGLPLLGEDQGTTKNHSHILSNIAIKEGKLEFKRIFDPIIGADHEGNPEN
ncbi:MAG: penicillin-binding transpeptidase domain-containing protein [Thermodesulfobacteriota bacterium]|nr:penicillin-binding transpeptidase domain-containing protein [Thermodesulfobacteriota bacterium]